MRIDFINDVEMPVDPEEFDEELGNTQRVSSSYYVKYLSDQSTEKAIQTIYYEPEMKQIQFQSISDFKGMTESMFEYNQESKEENCHIFQYHEVALGIKDTMDFLWRPSTENYMSYLGLVCLDEDFPNMHAFVGSDGTGNQYTAFFNPETMHPTIIKY